MQQHDSRAAAPDLDRTAFPQDRQRLFHAVLGKARRYGKAAPAGGLSPLLALAQRFGLYATAGSDFHGTGDHSADIGMAVSEDFLPWARLGVR